MSKQWLASAQILNDDECKSILSNCSQWAPGRLANGKVDACQRRCLETRLHADLESLGAKLRAATASFRGVFENCANELVEPPAVAHYRIGDHFDWHADDPAQEHRRTSCTIQLTTPTSYEGGELLVLHPDGDTSACVSKQRGRATFFPSTSLHTVTPITRGERYALVLWFR